MNLVLAVRVTLHKPPQWSEKGTEGVGQLWKTRLRTSELSHEGHLVLQVPLAASVTSEQSFELGKCSSACGLELLKEVGGWTGPGWAGQEAGRGQAGRGQGLSIRNTVRPAS